MIKKCLITKKSNVKIYFCLSSALIHADNHISSNLLSLLYSDNDITGVLDHTFCVEHNAYGEIIQHELKPNGKSIPVSEDTKKEYVRYEKQCFLTDDHLR